MAASPKKQDYSKPDEALKPDEAAKTNGAPKEGEAPKVVHQIVLSKARAISGEMFDPGTVLAEVEMKNGCTPDQLVLAMQIAAAACKES